MNHIEHPLRAHFDWIAAGGRPSKADVDELVRRCVDDHSEVTEDELRRDVAAATRKIMQAHKDGRSGAARTIARETTIVLSAGLGDLPPAPSRDQGKSVAEVVDTIQRSTI